MLVSQDYFSLAQKSHIQETFFQETESHSIQIWVQKVREKSTKLTW